MQPVTTVDIDAAIASLVSQIIEAVDPLKIILFGSHARGDARPDSDIDLLIVMPDGTQRRETAKHLYRTVVGYGFAKEFLVITESELERYADNIGLIYRTVLREGKTIYDSKSRLTS